jgi:ABC-type ATPase with predicted acetyltransferase domain
MPTLDAPAAAAIAPKDQHSWSESAYEWLLRSQQIQARSSVPHDPSSAAWSFARPSERNGTGIAFVDAALTKHGGSALPVVEIRGSHRTGKTCTLVTLAARFVTETRPSRYRSEQDIDIEKLPQVVILDSNQDAVASRLLCAVRSVLFRQSPEDHGLEQEMTSCMSRIHYVFSEDMAGWVPTLESLRSRLASASSDHPTLLLWDGFLSDVGEPSERVEVIRQLTRLMRDCTALLVTTTLPTRRFATWDKHVSQRITLEQVNPISEGGHDFCATVQNNQIPYTISSGGILC